MTYVEAFIAPVRTDRRDAYLAKAGIMARVFKEHGALSTTECWGSHVPDGEATSFPMSVKLEEGETVVLGWMRWASRAARDKGMQAAMSDPRMQAEMGDMPLDGKRMIFGGFDVMLES